MARTMTDEQEKAQRYDASKFGEEVQRLWIAELDAERAAHGETIASLNHERSAHEATKSRLALAEQKLELLEHGTHWDKADVFLGEAQELVEVMQANNADGYGLLKSAHDHIIAARGDLDADLK